MYLVNLAQIERQYKNNGQHAEQVVRYTLTGEIRKADNVPFTVSGDVGDLQVKSARATVCKGTDINEHLKADKATSYGYVTADFGRMFVMSRSEYKAFVEQFGTVTTESHKNGGAKKIRLGHETIGLIDWLERQL